MKRSIALFTVVLLILCLCSCSERGLRTDDPPTAAEQTNPDAVPTDTQGAQFRLSALPDIGKYSRKKPVCFYDEPLKEFRESDDYGLIIPYCVTSNSQVRSCGFMTADGRLITDAIYNEINPMSYHGDIVYEAVLKNFTSGEELSGEHSYRHAVELIRGDGGRRVFLSDDEAFVFSDYENIECRIPAAEGADENESLLIYDFDLNLVADLTGYNTSTGFFHEIDRNSFVIETLDELDTFLFFENGKLTNTYIPDDYYCHVYDGMICGETGVYSADGEPVYTAEGGLENFIYDKESDTLYFNEIESKSVIAMENGIVKFARRSYSGDISSIQLIRDGDETRVLLILGEDWGNYTGILVLDSGLFPLHDFFSPDGGLDYHMPDDNSYCLITVAEDGRTNVYDVTGRLAATLPFGYSEFVRTDDGCLVFSDNEETCWIYDSVDDSVTSYNSPIPDEDTGYWIRIAGNALIGEWALPGSDTYYMFRNYMTDRKTGKVMHRNITDLIITHTDDETYISLAENGTTYVYNGRLELITSFLNDYYA